MKKQYTLQNVPHRHNRLAWNPLWIALKTADAPAAKWFSSYTELCRVLAVNGFSPHQAEAILRSGWIDAAIRSYSKQKDGQHKGHIVAQYLRAQGITNNCPSIHKLVCDTFKDVVPNEQGVPCYQKKNLLSGIDILVPVDTPIGCDPSSETYHSM
jgi:hypothetical protein